MAVNKFLPFSTGERAVAMSDRFYEVDATRRDGIDFDAVERHPQEPGSINKALRQSTSMASAVGQFIADAGGDALDDGNIGALAEELENAVESKSKPVFLTQAEYDALEDPVDSGLYPSLAGKRVVITDVESVDVKSDGTPVVSGVVDVVSRLVSSDDPGKVKVDPDTGIMSANGVFPRYSAIQTAVDLNDFIEDGRYFFWSTAADAGSNFPLNNGGYMDVVRYDNNCHQMYHYIYAGGEETLYERVGQYISGAWVWPAWGKRPTTLELDLMKPRTVSANNTGPGYFKLGTFTLHTEIMSHVCSLIFAGGVRGAIDTHYTGRLLFICRNTNATITTQMNRVHYDLATIPTNLSNVLNFGYTAEPSLAPGNTVTLWVYISSYLEMFYQNIGIAGINANKWNVTAEGFLTADATSAPPGWVGFSAV